VADLIEFDKKLTEKFGGGRPGLNRFYEKTGYAEITWEQKMWDGTKTFLPMGRVVSINPCENLKGQAIWKKYVCKQTPFHFYEELYRQLNSYLSKKEYGEKMRLRQLAGLEQSIGTEITNEMNEDYAMGVEHE
jgi:hypothetical protein